MKRTLMTTPRVRVDVAHYAAGERQAPHRDLQSRVTFVLQGAFCEEADPGAARLAPGDVLFKSNRARHEDRFSEYGARLLSLVFKDDGYDMAGADDWRVCRNASGLRTAVAALEAAVGNDEHGLAAAAADLLSVPHVESARTAPAWLTRIKDAIESTSLANVDVAAEARAAGVHPAHASRLFRRCFATSITEHAQIHCVRRALARLGQDECTLSEIALAAGFYDQSHMTRVFRRVTGRTPGLHRALLAAAG